MAAVGLKPIATSVARFSSKTSILFSAFPSAGSSSSSEKLDDKLLNKCPLCSRRNCGVSSSSNEEDDDDEPSNGDVVVTAYVSTVCPVGGDSSTGEEPRGLAQDTSLTMGEGASLFSKAASVRGDMRGDVP